MNIIPNPYLMLFVFIVFITLIYLLNQWLYKPMLNFVADREKSIEQDIHNTQSIREEISKTNEEIAQVLANARKEAMQILEEANQEAKITHKNKINAKKVENEAKLADYKAKLLEEEEVLYQNICAQFPTFEQAISAKLKDI